MTNKDLWGQKSYLTVDITYVYKIISGYWPEIKHRDMVF
jgi:hypothetical protein